MRSFTATTLTALLMLTGCAGSSQGATPSPDSDARSATTAAPVVSCPNQFGGACLGPLEAGTYETTVFEPTLTYSVFDDTWANMEDLPGNFWLFRPQDSQDGALGGSSIGVYQNVAAAAIDCTDGPQPGVGTTPEELVEFYQGVPGLQVSEPVEVSVGGLQGYQVDVAVKRKDTLCNFDGLASTPMIIGNGVSELHHVVAPQLDMRLILLSWRRGNVTIEITNIHKQYTADKWHKLVQPIVESFQFG